jgi:hypothetical protein
MSDDERGEDGNIEIYLRLKPIPNPSKKVEFDLAEGKARRGRRSACGASAAHLRSACAACAAAAAAAAAAAPPLPRRVAP